MGRFWLWWTAPPNRVRVNHSLANWDINGTLLSPSTCLCWPTFSFCSLQWAGVRQKGPRALLSLSTQRYVIQQSFCKNAFTVHRPMSLSLRVKCGDCNSRGGGPIPLCLAEIWYGSPPAKDEVTTKRGEGGGKKVFWRKVMIATKMKRELKFLSWRARQYLHAYNPLSTAV